jgi:hypothetical protein
MLRGWGSRLVDKCDYVGPIFFEGVDRLDDRRGFVLARDPIFLLLGVHPASFDDAQADVDDITIIHQVACCPRVGCADEEACCKGLESAGGMPVGGHLLPILFTIFGRCFAVLRDEPIEHVRKTMFGCFM